MKAVKRHKVTTKCAAAEGALRNSKKATSGPEKHFKLKMWVLSVVSRRHSSSVCVSFISILSAAGGVGRPQVVADDLPRSGEATTAGREASRHGIHQELDSGASLHTASSHRANHS